MSGLNGESANALLELRAARIPFIGGLALHHWFVLEGTGAPARWEVWQRADAGGESWGHLHRNLMPPRQGVGNGASWRVHCWRGAAAGALMDRISTSPAHYPWCERYRVWPGPNSNTYVQWILGDDFRLGWTAWGARYWIRGRQDRERHRC